MARCFEINDVSRITESSLSQTSFFFSGHPNKTTVVARMGLEKARAYVAELEAEAIKTLTPFGERAEWLVEATKFVVTRGH